MNDDRARQGVEHLQAAAVEVISALRAFLDVAEDLVRDPAAAAVLASSWAETATRMAASAAATVAPPAQDHPSDPRVTRIRVS